MAQSSTIMQIVTPVGARHLPPGNKYICFLIWNSFGGGGLTFHDIHFYKAAFELIF